MFIRSLSLITVLTPDFPGVKRGVKTQFTLIQLPSDWDHTRYKMVCAKCQKSQKKTELATPGVKRKNDLYLGSPASNDKGKSSATSNASGVGKIKATNFAIDVPTRLATSTELGFTRRPKRGLYNAEDMGPLTGRSVAPIPPA
ncbi:hypothetical protein HO133_010092 [Letharia lupina]|uniref:Uncharacterized protein n=1 Tax=Letharia lupina TaxID=560253 RepID=A0A8H6FEH2_9LECA|nr:uncharacterized protein HO133_010092 [Letharia lupina]KAF6224898.1 hypothetical protein HO133_010092 [Letharia lupina]